MLKFVQIALALHYTHSKVILLAAIQRILDTYMGLVAVATTVKAAVHQYHSDTASVTSV